MNDTSPTRRLPDLETVSWPAFEAIHVPAVVTTRTGGTSEGPYASLDLGLHVGDDPISVIENRRRVAQAINAELETMVFAQQVHGRHAEIVGSADRGRGTISVEDAIPATDVLVTTTPNITLAILVADCVPIVLVDPGAGVIAAVHAGWRGTVSGAAASAVETMVTLGADPRNVVAGIGPSIAPVEYQVGKEVASAVRAVFQPSSTSISTSISTSTSTSTSILTPDSNTPDRWFLDLQAANRKVLTDAGVPAASIHGTGLFTNDTDMFFSDRAARPCGRFGLFARLRP